METTHQYMKMRFTCGRQPLFCKAGPDMCDSIAVDPSEHRHYILRNPVHECIQHTPVYCQHDINTDTNQGMEHYVLQNNAIDMYHNYYREMVPQPPVERFSVRTVNEYHDSAQRAGSGLCWQPDQGHRFAVAYVRFGDFYRTPVGPLGAHVWDVDDSNEPELVLQPSAPLFDLQYCPRERELLAGGLATGQVCVWDTRRGSQPVAESPPHLAHRDYVRGVLFISTKSGLEFFSGGPDGVCKWWDIRSLDESTDQMIIDLVKAPGDTQSMATANGISVLEYEPTIPTRFMVGCENGLVVGGNRKGKIPLEQLPAHYEAHSGPVWSLERNPAFLKNFLTVGDWRLRVWSEECRDSPVLWSAAARRRQTSAAWSPTRISLLSVTGTDGRLTLWDLLRRQHAPVLTKKVAREALIRQRFHEGGALLALGGGQGTTYLVELSHQLAESEANDKALLTAVFERESKRECILEARLREIRLKQRQAEEGSGGGEQPDDKTAGDKDLTEAAIEYAVQVKKEQALIF